MVHGSENGDQDRFEFEFELYGSRRGCILAGIALLVVVGLIVWGLIALHDYSVHHHTAALAAVVEKAKSRMS